MRRLPLVFLAGLLVTGCKKKVDEEGEGIEEGLPEAGEGEAGRGKPARPEREGPPKGLEILPNNRWKVPRKMKERLQDNPGRLADTEEHNKGYKLKVRHESTGWWLGLRTGDVVLKINDLPIDTKMQLMSTWMKVKNKDRLVLTIRRDGELLEHTYIIVD